MTFKAIFLCLSIAFVSGQEFPRKTSNNSEGSKHFIYNGEVANTDEAKFMVALFRVRSFLIFWRYKYNVCGGSLIDPVTILTAAHCFDSGDKWIVRYGTNNLEQKRFPDIEVDLKNVIFHPNFKHGEEVIQEDDIAIVKLPHPVHNQEPGHMSFAKLPERDDFKKYEVGTEVTTYGWGMLNAAGKFPMDLMKTTLRIFGRFRNRYKIYESNKQIYAINKYSSTCEGDSGGPLILDNRLIGITSGGVGDCWKPDRMNIFAKVHSHLDWIAENRKQ